MLKLKDIFSKTKLPEITIKEVKNLENEIEELKQKLEENFDEQLDNLEKFASKGFSDGFGNYHDLAHEEISAETLQRLFTSEGWFYIAVKTISNAISTLPWIVEKRKIVKTTDRHGNESFDEIWFTANAEPEYDLLKYPNGCQIPTEFYQLIAIDLLSTGKAFIFTDPADDPIDENNRPHARLQEIMRDRRKCKTEAMYRLNSAMTTPRLSKDGTIEYYEYQTSEGLYKFDPKYIIPIKLPNPLDSFNGLAPIVPVLKNLLIDRFSSEHMIRFYKQGARLGGVITSDKNLNKDQMARATRSFEHNYTGKQNHHRTLILPKGMDYKVIEQNPGETSLIEFSKFNKEPILSAYNVPPIKVGLLDGATYANALIQYKVFWEDAVKPVANTIVSAINFSQNIFSNSRGLRGRLDYSEVKALQEDEDQKADTSVKLLNSGWTPNEVRKEIWDKEPLDGGDKCPVIVRVQAQASGSLFGMLGVKPRDIKTEGSNEQPDNETLTDIEPTTISFSERVTQLTLININNGLSLAVAVQAAMEQAITEGFAPEDDTVKPTQEVQESEQATSDGKININENKIVYGKVTQEHLFTYAKALTGDGVKELIDNKFDEVVLFFKRLEKIFIDASKDAKTDDEGKIIKSFYCLSRKGQERIGRLPSIKADESGLPTDKILEQFSLEEADSLSETELKALMHGFENTLISHSATFPNSEATAYLMARAGDKIVGITETTKIQIDAYAAQVSPKELASRIHEKFEEIMNYEGRAMSIAVTETLSAVSEGQEFKKDNFLKEVPEAEKKLEKTWITADDSRVRKSHIPLNNETVKHDEKFSNGLMYPRDKKGKAKEVIRCRCAVVYHTKEDTGLIDAILESLEI